MLGSQRIANQVTKYWRGYGQVLVTNYRDFVLLGRDAEGAAVKVGTLRKTKQREFFDDLDRQE